MLYAFETFLYNLKISFKSKQQILTMSNGPYPLRILNYLVQKLDKILKRFTCLYVNSIRIAFVSRPFDIFAKCTIENRCREWNK